MPAGGPSRPAGCATGRPGESSTDVSSSRDRRHTASVWMWSTCRRLQARCEWHDQIDFAVGMAVMRACNRRHPNGEIDLIMPLAAGAKFDGREAGWLVYGPGSVHSPTVTHGRALVLYLLPGGAIEFTKP